MFLIKAEIIIPYKLYQSSNPPKLKKFSIKKQRKDIFLNRLNKT
jgi:hypothetical protein